MRHRIVRLGVAGIAFCAGVLALAGVPAQAAGTPKVTLSPLVKLYASTHSYQTITVTGNGEDLCDPDVTLDAVRGDFEWPALTPKGTSYTDEIGSTCARAWSGRVRFNATSTYGRWYVSLTYWPRYGSGSGWRYREYDDVKSFYVKRNTVVSSFNAGPEPVRKGKTITVNGYLRRLTPYGSNGSPAYVGYSRAKVKLQFKAKGRTSYTTIATLTTSSSGYFKGVPRAKGSGAWRVVFDGTGYHAPRTVVGDYVEVR